VGQQEMEAEDCPASSALSCLQDIARRRGLHSWSSQHLNGMSNRDLFIQKICCMLAKTQGSGKKGGSACLWKWQRSSCAL